MACDELLRLLQARSLTERNKREKQNAVTGIVTHIRSCPRCRHGLVQLSTALVARSKLTCNQCRARFPAYYEATRPEFPMVHMSDSEILKVMLHLGSCDACREEYEELVLLSELEERDEGLS